MSEGVIKSGHREPFTVLYKSAIRDTRLSFEMLGFLTYMLDKPPDWEFTISGMAKEREFVVVCDGASKKVRYIGNLCIVSF